MQRLAGTAFHGDIARAPVGLVFFCLFLATMIYAVGRGVAPSIIVGLIFTVTAVFLAFAVSKRHGRLAHSFFAAAAIHAIFGYVGAEYSEFTIWIQDFDTIHLYRRAFVIVGLGLLFCSVGYALPIGRSVNQLTTRLGRFRISDALFLRCARVTAVGGALLMFSMYLYLGYLPIFTLAPGAMRYITQDLSVNYLRDEWIVNRALDLLTYSLPFVATAALWRGRLIDWVISIAGLLAFLMPLRRANMLSVILVILVVSALSRRGRIAHYVAVVLVLIVLYFASQVVFLQLFNLDFEAESGFTLAGSAFPEVRDLGWMLTMFDNEWLLGRTLVQPFVLIPSFWSDFTQKNSLRNVTTELIGLDDERQTGGLRLTLAGEAYLNLGYPGVMLIGVILGVCIAFLERAVILMMRARSAAGLYVAVTCMVWLCVWVYLAGTQAAATVKVGLIIFAVMIALSVRFASSADRAPGIA